MIDEDRLYEIKALLDKREASPPHPYWLIGEDESLCWKCLHAKMPDAEIGVDFEGGYCWESDGCFHCEKCGRLLQFILTEYGVASELAHYAEFPPEKFREPDLCYHLARVAYGIYGADQVRQFLAITRAMLGDAQEDDSP